MDREYVLFSARNAFIAANVTAFLIYGYQMYILNNPWSYMRHVLTATNLTFAISLLYYLKIKK